jgi:fibronectin-binding autotransporter adhesin
MNPPIPFFYNSCLFAVLCLLSLSPLSAQTYTWTNAAGGSWTDTANWDPSTNYARNLAGVTALFGDFAGVGNSIAVTMATTTVRTMGAQTVGLSGDDNYTLGATNQGRLGLAGTDQLVSATGSGAHTINSVLRFGLLNSPTNVVATISNDSTGVLTLNRLETLGTIAAAHELRVTGSGNTVINTAVINPAGGGQSNSVGVVKSGAGTLTFNASPGTPIKQGITIDGGAVVLSAASTNYTGGTTINSGGRLVVGAANAISATSLALNSGGTLQLGNASSGSVTGAIGNNGTITFNFTQAADVTNVISGSGGVLHDRGSRVSLTASNAYSGGTRVASTGSSDVLLGVSSDNNLGDVSGALTLAGAGRGTLRLDAAGFSSARNIVLEESGGRLAVGSAGDTGLFSGSITGAGGLTAGISVALGGSASGVITLSGALSYSGPTAVAFGTLVLSNAAGTNALTGGFGTGSGALIKDGAGVLQLSGSNAATGSLTIQGGTVRAAGATNLYGSGNITVTNASVLEATESFTLSRRLIMGSASDGTNSVGVVNVAADKELTLDAGSGGVGGVGQMVKTGNGTLILASSNNVNNGTDAAMFLQAGTLVVTNTGTLGNPTAGVFFAMNGGALDLGTTTQAVGGFTVNDGTVSNGTISNSGTYNVAGGTIAAALNGASANLTKTGSGTMTLSGANSYAGGTLVSVGTLQIGNGGATGSLSTSGAITNNAVLAFSRSNTVTQGTAFANAISGSGSVVQNGTGGLLLGAGNTYAGATVVNGGGTGFVRIAADSALGAAPGAATAGHLILSNGALVTIASFTLSANRGILLSGSGGQINTAAGTLTYGGSLEGSSGLEKAGAGTLTLSGVNTYSGDTLVSAGTLNLSNSTGVALSNPGLVTVAGGATLLISQSNQANGAAVTLSGGTIARGSGVSGVFGALNLTGASSLNFGSGAAGAMSFGIYEAAATPSALLTVNSFFAGNTLTFGTDLSGYITNSYTGTAFTSEFFNINSTSGGFTSDWNGSTFTITAIPEPSTCAVAAGLAALFLGSVGRRLVRATQGRRP